MKRLLLWIVALVIAAAPVLADVCRLNCERERQPACPLHQQAPHKCAHDHTVGGAGLTRAIADVPRPVPSAIVVARIDVTGGRASTALPGIDDRHAPPNRSPRTDVLRI
jgi:hypothetical protein